MYVSHGITSIISDVQIRGNIGMHHVGASFRYTHLTLRNVLFEANRLRRGGTPRFDALALGAAYLDSGSPPIANCTFRGHNSHMSTVWTAAAVLWTCEPGTYMPRAGGGFTGNWTGCLLHCATGYYGDGPHHPDQTCAGPCWAGHYCVSGTAIPRPCPRGTYLPDSGEMAGYSFANCLVRS